eukprot:215064_1
MFIPEDIDDVLLTQIEDDLRINNNKQIHVINTLLIMSHNVQFRNKYLQTFDITALEIYLNAKDFNQKKEEEEEHILPINISNYYAMKYISILPFHIQLNIKYILPTQLFNNNEEGNAYAKLQFYNYKPYCFQNESDTFQQMK